MGEWIYRCTFFLTSALAGSEWSFSRPGRFIPGERAPGIHWIGGWVETRAGLDEVEKRKFLTLPGFELRTLCRPARSYGCVNILIKVSINIVKVYLIGILYSLE
jgi:hypothetical protein